MRDGGNEKKWEMERAAGCGFSSVCHHGSGFSGCKLRFDQIEVKVCVFVCGLSTSVCVCMCVMPEDICVYVYICKTSLFGQWHVLYLDMWHDTVTLIVIFKLHMLSCFGRKDVILMYLTLSWYLKNIYFQHQSYKTCFSTSCQNFRGHIL